MTPIEVALISTAISGAFTIGGIFFTDRLTRKRETATTLRQAVYSFKAAFADEIFAVEHGDTDLHTLAKAIEKHRLAVWNVMPLLTDVDKGSLSQAWGKYCGTEDKADPCETHAFILGYNHPDLAQDGKTRFKALHSCLDHLVG